jgi:predicted RND superfamily exporter protein
MRSIGFGLERIALHSVARPWLAAAFIAFLLAVAGFGFLTINFDEDLGSVFSGNTKEFAAYEEATRQFANPESEIVVLVEGRDLGDPETFGLVRDFQFELQFIDGVVNVFSPFGLRGPPVSAGNAPPLILDDSATELTPDLVSRVRGHPLLGAKLLSADASVMLFVLTPETSETASAALAEAGRIEGEIEAISANLFAGSDITLTITGFPIIRMNVVEILIHDQRVLNIVGAAIGFLLSLIVFRSLVAAVMTAVPAITSGIIVAGGLGAVGIPITVMTNIVPVLVMILGYADSMHLCRTWRLQRDQGVGIADAARFSITTVGPACILASLTTAVAFLSLVFSEVNVVSDFGWVGALGCIVGVFIVLTLHGLFAVTLGRFWKAKDGTASTIMGWLAGPSAATARFVTGNVRAINLAVFALLVVLATMYAALQPEYSIREHLSAKDPAIAALTTIDDKLGGSHPVHIIVPLGDLPLTSPEAIEKIGATHRAVASIDGVGSPLSLWSLVEWLGGDLDSATLERVQTIIDDLPQTSRQRFYGRDGGTLVSVSIGEAPTGETEALIDRIEAAAKAAGGPEVFVTGVTVITAREATRTIGNLNYSLMGAVVSGLLVILIAFRSWRIAATSIVPNVLPLLGTGAILFMFGRGLQFNGVLALTVAFGIAVDGTIHYLNHFLRSDADSLTLKERLVKTSRGIGPQLFGTTAVIVTGLAATQTSEMPTVALFGMLTAVTLLIGLVGDLIVLPALMAGAAKRWFTKDPVMRPVARGAA